MSYLYDVLELFVVLHLFFVVADSLSVVTAEISIAVLHPLSYFTRELENKENYHLCHRDGSLLFFGSLRLYAGPYCTAAHKLHCLHIICVSYCVCVCNFILR